MNKKVLFIQHAATASGGSSRSLLYTVEGIIKQSNYQPIVGLAKPNNSLIELYEKCEVKVIPYPIIHTYEHTTARSYSLINPVNWFRELNQFLNIKQAKKKTIKLLYKVRPDIVHLNSVVLVGSALAVKALGISLVWHVREHSVKGLFGCRRHYIKKLLATLPDKSIFISKADKASWGNPATGEVIYNFVNFDKYNHLIKASKHIKEIVRIRNKFRYPVLLYMGGMVKIKGAFIIPKVLKFLKQDYPDLICLMPAAAFIHSGRWQSYVARAIFPIFGWGTLAQRFDKNIKKMDIADAIVRLLFVHNINEYIALADVVVFPSIKPHFARPVIEAIAMGKNVVASDLDGMRELIPDKKIGLLAEPSNPNDLYEKIKQVLEFNNDYVKEKVTFARKNFEAGNNITKIIRIYDELNNK